MKRRRFLAVLDAPPILHVLIARGQQRSGPAVRFLNSASPATYSFNATAFREGLREAGYSVIGADDLIASAPVRGRGDRVITLRVHR